MGPGWNSLDPLQVIGGDSGRSYCKNAPIRSTPDLFIFIANLSVAPGLLSMFAGYGDGETPLLKAIHVPDLKLGGLHTQVVIPPRDHGGD